MDSYDDNLQFIKNVIQRSELHNSITNELSQLTNRIQQRQNDPNLYLAIIGEFSSGKSTFINALLRQDLLKTSALVTTATATRIKYGRQIVAKAQFITPEKAEKHRQFLLKNINIQSSEIKPIEQQQEKHQITSNQQSYTGSWLWGIIIWVIIVIIFKPTGIIVLMGFVLVPLLSYIIGSLVGTSNNTSKSEVLESSKKSQKNKSIISSKEFTQINMKTFLEQVTSNEEIAQDVINVTISHTSVFLANNIVIIDLPGTNATNTRHATVAKNVIENEADLAIIITPATQLLTQSLVNFVTTTIGDYLNRCIFMITRMDEIRPRTEKEYNRIFENAKQRINDMQGINNPQIYSCSAQIIIDDILGEKQVVSNPQDWIEQFSQIQVQIVNHLHSERQASINNSIERVFNQLFYQLDHQLKQQWQDYRLKQESLQREMIPNLTSFTQTQHRECQRMIEQSLLQTESQIYNCINTHKENIISSIRSTIFSASDWDELKSVINSRVESILRDDQQSLGSDVQNKCNILKQSAIEAGRYFDQKFTEVYSRLKALGGQVDINSISSSINIEINTGSVVYSAQQLNSQNLGNTMRGLFSHLFKGLLNDRKNEVWNIVNSQLYNYFEAIQQQAKQNLKMQSQGVANAINQRIDNYIQHYQTIVDQILNEQEMELKRLVSLQETIQQDLSEITQRRDSMRT